MGTNYYHRTNICHCCNRYDEQHICKSMVMFEAPRVWSPEVSEWGVVLTSWQAWKARLRADGEVWDEYGEQVEVEDFVARVEATSAESRRRQFDWVSRNRPERAGVVGEGTDWLDADGFSFYGGAFS